MRLLHFPVLATAVLMVFLSYLDQVGADIVIEVDSSSEDSIAAKLLETIELDDSVFFPEWLSSSDVAPTNVSVFAKSATYFSESQQRETYIARWFVEFDQFSDELAVFKASAGQPAISVAPASTDSIAIYEIDEMDKESKDHWRTASGVYGVGEASKDWYRFEKVIVR